MSADLDGEALLVARQVLQREARLLKSDSMLYSHVHTETKQSIEAKRAAVVRADEVIASWFPQHEVRS